MSRSFLVSGTVTYMGARPKTCFAFVYVQALFAQYGAGGWHRCLGVVELMLVNCAAGNLVCRVTFVCVCNEVLSWRCVCLL